MKVLFIISSSDTAFWLSEVTHPYWHFVERGIEVDFASPSGGRVVYDPYGDPYFKNSTESEDLVGKGFLSDKALVAKLESTLILKKVDLSQYDAVHVAGGRGATFDLYPNADVAKALEYFWAKDKVVGAICHGAIALGNTRGASVAARPPATRVRETRIYSACLGTISAYRTFRRRCSKKSVQTIRGLHRMIRM
jgi:putative intracellular protease/amidase